MKEKLQERVVFGLSRNRSRGEAQDGGGTWRREDIPGRGDGVHKGLGV